MSEEPNNPPPEEDFKDKYFRAIAELENARKRLLKEKLEAIGAAQEDVITDFLQPIDNFENALRFAKGGSDELKNWAIGFEMILGQLKSVLTQHQVTSYESLHKTFDPALHDAVESVETEEHPAGTILQEFCPGYRMNGHTIRPARVKVAKKKEDHDEKK